MSRASDAAGPLAGVGVLITRPAHQAAHLAELVERAGGVAIRFPTIEIAPPADPERLLGVFEHLDEFDLAIFVSRNAVEQAFAWLHAAKRAWPARLPAACVGRATAEALGREGISATTPAQRFDSEAVLALSLLQDVAGKKVVIFRGDGGRELLADTLTARGAAVTYAECYRRARPRADVEALIEAWRRDEIQVVVVTSTDGLRNLHDMLGESGRGWLHYTPVVVLSRAQVAACRTLGCLVTPLLATEPSDEAILEAVKAWRKERPVP